MMAALGLLMGCPAMGQFTHGTTGLLQMPTADMQKDKTFMFGGSRLSKHATPYRWSYDTYNYYVNVTFFPWLEVAYTMTIFDENGTDITDIYSDAVFNWTCSIEGVDSTELDTVITWLDGTTFNKQKIKFSNDRSYED